MTDQGKRRLRSQDWWDDYKEPDMTAVYLERYLNYGLTRGELQSGRPTIGIAAGAAGSAQALPADNTAPLARTLQIWRLLAARRRGRPRFC